LDPDNLRISPEVVEIIITTCDDIPYRVFVLKKNAVEFERLICKFKASHFGVPEFDLKSILRRVQGKEADKAADPSLSPFPQILIATQEWEDMDDDTKKIIQELDSMKFENPLGSYCIRNVYSIHID